MGDKGVQRFILQEINEKIPDLDLGPSFLPYFS